MKDFIGTFIVGALCIVLGVLNMKGNVSSIHSYHRRRVAQEDLLPFGRGVGLGTVIAGGSLVVFGALRALSQSVDAAWLTLAGTAVLVVGLTAGLGISLYTIIKYNKGIF